VNLKLKRTPGIYLAGFMGSGKGTVGQALARELGWPFVDLDAMIERQQGTAIAAIFEKQGERAFREIETEAIRCCIRDVEAGHPRVVALGGGAFVEPGNFELLENNGVTLWLDCPFEMVRRRAAATPERPLARDPQRFEQLYNQRTAGYARADFRIPIESDDPADALRTIRALKILS